MQQDCHNFLDRLLGRARCTVGCFVDCFLSVLSDGLVYECFSRICGSLDCSLCCILGNSFYRSSLLFFLSLLLLLSRGFHGFFSDGAAVGKGTVCPTTVWTFLKVLVHLQIVGTGSAFRASRFLFLLAIGLQVSIVVAVHALSHLSEFFKSICQGATYS